MNTLTQEILARVSTLPEQEQQETLNFIEFLQTKSGHQLLKNDKYKNRLDAISDSLLRQQKTCNEESTSPIYQAFEQAGLIGCIETNEQLSTTYKEKLDFSFKHGMNK